MKVISIPEMATQMRQRRSGKSFLAKFIQECSIEDAIIIPNNATNGDMIKAMFPNAKVAEKFQIGNYDEVYYVLIEVTDGATNEMRVMKNWWNAPYRAESEE